MEKRVRRGGASVPRLAVVIAGVGDVRR